MNKMSTQDELGDRSVKRLPLYLRILHEMRDAGETYASGAVVAKILCLDPIVVRKDLARCGVRGTPRLGFPIQMMIDAIEELLGCNIAVDAVMVGVGRLGSALLGYPGFAQYGLHVVAAFDLDPARVGDVGVPVYPVARMEDVLQRTHARLGILTVPADAAQGLAERMVAGGIKGIWNFTPAHLKVPPEVIVKRENLAVSLAVLSHRLRAAGLA